MSGLEHDHLVSQLGWGRCDQGQGLLMEYLPGGTAEALVRHSDRLSPGEVLTVVAPIASAVAYLHGQGVSHGDISPGNILFTADGRPQLVDLGLAALPGRRGQRAGTEGFMAPELHDESAVDDPRRRQGADVYSLAGVTWFLLTGHPAEPTFHRPPLPGLRQDVPAAAVDLIERGLAEDPDERPSAAEFWRDIFALGNPEPLDLRASADARGLARLVTSAVTPAHRRAKRRRGSTRFARWRPQRGIRRGVSPRVRLEARRARGVGEHAPHWKRRGILLGGALVAIVAGALYWGFESASERAGQPAAGTSRAMGNPHGREPSAAQLPGGDEAAATRARTEAVLNDLAMQRAEALVNRNSDALDEVYIDDAAARPDIEVIEALELRGEVYQGLQLSMEVDSVASANAATQVVEAVGRLSAYRVMTEDGEVVEDVSGTTRQDLTVTLVRTDGAGWKISSLTAEDPA
ncbi:hypothetical protein IW252_002428 [Zhihengliuella flava]|uniref:Protein kinase domain-containing protein n=2 Tax=Zhihengliuella flava TaxID=1285193 RepID=A0A931DDW0_9MICC|nr:hypothetical protein [Zhihengliuella flava]